MAKLLSIFVSIILWSHIYAESSVALEGFHICTVASYECENLSKLVNSCKRHQIDLEILGLGLPYYGNGTKLIRMKEYLAELDEGDIVMFVDAFDVLIVMDKARILEKFLSMDSPFVMSTEKQCYPMSWLSYSYPASPTPFKYINSGSYIGYVGVLKAWLNSLEPIKVDFSDQAQITKKYLKGTRFFILDCFCEMFLTLWNVEASELEIDSSNNVVRFLTTNSEPCLLHANGNSFSIYDTVYEKLNYHAQ